MFRPFPCVFMWPSRLFFVAGSENDPRAVLNQLDKGNDAVQTSRNRSLPLSEGGARNGGIGQRRIQPRQGHFSKRRAAHWTAAKATE